MTRGHPKFEPESRYLHPSDTKSFDSTPATTIGPETEEEVHEITGKGVLKSVYWYFGGAQHASMCPRIYLDDELVRWPFDYSIDSAHDKGVDKGLTWRILDRDAMAREVFVEFKGELRFKTSCSLRAKSWAAAGNGTCIVQGFWEEEP